MSTSMSESVDLLEPQQQIMKTPPVNIEFTDLTYTVPQGRNGSKVILRSVNGLFKSGQLTAILGPSGAGKSTLLNVLAGYKSGDASGSILVNGQPRVLQSFYKISRYIMQEDLIRPQLTVMESLKFASDLKLGFSVPWKQKKQMINEILQLLRLVKCKKTLTSCLSGGEKKRLSIALELVNNPSVIFLDEPTTGLDDLASSQCISLLKTLAHGGRTVICSVHTPSARLFAQFDHVYIVSEGQCMFQGRGQDIVPFLESFGLYCPKHYNPADFMVEVSSGEYGDHSERMVTAIDNGRCYCWNQAVRQPEAQANDTETNTSIEMNQLKHLCEYESSSWLQFVILTKRMMLQTWRELNYLTLKGAMYVFVGLIIGSLFFQMGQDGSKTYFIFAYCFLCMIVVLYLPMLPALAYFPQEIKLLKREYFNRWYGLSPYFCSLTLNMVPIQAMLTFIFTMVSYIMSDQPLDLHRVIKFNIIAMLVSVISESFGLMVASRFNIVNSVFIGPACSVYLMLLSVYGVGAGSHLIPFVIRIAMKLTYIRYGLECLVSSIYEDRATLVCPSSEMFCNYKDPRVILKEVGMEGVNFWVNISALVFFFFLFKIISYILLRQRLIISRQFGALSYIGRMIKLHFSLSERTK